MNFLPLIYRLKRNLRNRLSRRDRAPCLPDYKRVTSFLFDMHCKFSKRLKHKRSSPHYRIAQTCKEPVIRPSVIIMQDRGFSKGFTRNAHRASNAAPFASLRQKGSLKYNILSCRNYRFKRKSSTCSTSSPTGSLRNKCNRILTANGYLALLHTCNS